MSILTLCPLALLLLAQDRREPVERGVPWAVVDQPTPNYYDNLHNPQLVLRSDGSLIAAVTHGGHYGSIVGTYIYRSTDRGASWSKVAPLWTPNDAGLIEVGGKLFLLGTYSSAGKPPGRAEISCSSDGGATWEKMTLLGSPDRLQTSESTVLRDQGRIWQLFGRREIAGGEVTSHLSVASAPVDSDLMKSDSWNWSEELTQPGHGWYCSLLATGTEGAPILLGRTYGESVKFVADLKSDGCELSLRGSTRCPELPDRWVRSLARDPTSGRTSLLKSVDRPQPEWGISEIRLVSSTDLGHWDDRSTLLRDGRKDGVSFGWCAQAYDGEDLLLLLCARVPGTPEAGIIRIPPAPKGSAEHQRGWNVLFLRVPKFRERTPETPPLWDSSH